MVAVHSFSEVTERLHSVRQPQLLVPVRLCGVLQFSDSLQNGALGSFNALQQLLTVKLRDSAVVEIKPLVVAGLEALSHLGT